MFDLTKNGMPCLSIFLHTDQCFAWFSTKTFFLRRRKCCVKCFAVVQKKGELVLFSDAMLMRVHVLCLEAGALIMQC